MAQRVEAVTSVPRILAGSVDLVSFISKSSLYRMGLSDCVPA